MAAKNKHLTNDDTSEGNEIRVLLADLPGALTEYVGQSLQEKPDLRILGYAQGYLELLSAVGRRTDVLLLGADKIDPPPGICSHLLSEFPDLKILVLARDEAAIYWMKLHRQQIGQVSTVDNLLNYIRQAYSLDTQEICPSS
jgi:hypothetical protein